MNTYDFSLVNKICLNCKQDYCIGYCQEYKNSMKALRTKNLIPKRGRPKKSNKCIKLDK